MEPVITLAATTLSVILPFVAKGAEEFIKAAGKDAYENAKALFHYVKEKLSANEEYVSTVANFEKNPQRHATAVEDILKEAFLKDEEFANQVSLRLRTLGPRISVLQEVDKAKDLTGARVRTVSDGEFEIVQRITDAENVVGFEADEVRSRSS